MEERHFMRYNLLFTILPISFGTACLIKFSKYLHFLRKAIPQHHLKIYSKIKFLLHISPLLFPEYLQKERIIPSSCFFLLPEQKTESQEIQPEFKEENHASIYIGLDFLKFSCHLGSIISSETLFPVLWKKLVISDPDPLPLTLSSPQLLFSLDKPGLGISCSFPELGNSPHWKVECLMAHTTE